MFAENQVFETIEQLLCEAGSLKELNERSEGLDLGRMTLYNYRSGKRPPAPEKYEALRALLVERFEMSAARVDRALAHSHENRVRALHQPDRFRKSYTEQTNQGLDELLFDLAEHERQRVRGLIGPREQARRALASVRRLWIGWPTIRQALRGKWPLTDDTQKLLIKSKTRECADLVTQSIINVVPEHSERLNHPVVRGALWRHLMRVTLGSAEDAYRGEQTLNVLQESGLAHADEDLPKELDEMLADAIAVACARAASVVSHPSMHVARDYVEISFSIERSAGFWGPKLSPGETPALNLKPSSSEQDIAQLLARHFNVPRESVAVSLQDDDSECIVQIRHETLTTGGREHIADVLMG